MRTSKSKVWLVEFSTGETLTRRACATTLKGAWGLAKVWLDTTSPNLDYRKTLAEAQQKPVLLWCTKRWRSEEEALWNPEGQSCTISLVPLVHTV